MTTKYFDDGSTVRRMRNDRQQKANKARRDTMRAVRKLRREICAAQFNTAGSK